MGEVRQVFVDSTNRDITIYKGGSDFVLHLTEPIKDITCVELVQASVPSTMYNVKKHIGTDKQIEITVGTFSPFAFNIPPGFYSGPDLALLISTTLANSGVPIVVTFSTSHGKFLFTADAAVSFSIKFNDPSLARSMGFLYDNTSITYESDTVNASSPSITITSGITNIEYETFAANYFDKCIGFNGNNFILSPIIADLHSDNAVFLDIEELRTPFHMDARKIDNGKVDGNNISRSFGLIPLDVNSGGIKTFKKNSDYEFCIQYVNPIRKLDRLTVRWTDKNGTIVNFNGLEDNSFILRFHTLRKNL